MVESPDLGKRDDLPEFLSVLMAFKLLLMAQKRWRRINGARKVPLVRAGVQFCDGLAVERQATARKAA